MSISRRCNLSQQSILYMFQITGCFRPSCIDTICLIFSYIMSFIFTAFVSTHLASRIISLSSSFYLVAATQNTFISFLTLQPILTIAMFALALHSQSVFLYLVSATYLHHETSYLSLHHICTVISFLPLQPISTISIFVSFIVCVSICMSISRRCNLSQQSILYMFQITGCFRPSCIDTICLIFSYIMSFIFTAFVSTHLASRIISLSSSFYLVAATQNTFISFLTLQPILTIAMFALALHSQSVFLYLVSATYLHHETSYLSLHHICTVISFLPLQPISTISIFVSFIVCFSLFYISSLQFISTITIICPSITLLFLNRVVPT